MNEVPDEEKALNELTNIEDSDMKRQMMKEWNVSAVWTSITKRTPGVKSIEGMEATEV